MDERSEEKEWMDSGLQFCTLETYHDCLHQLDRIGRYLGGDRATFKALERLPQKPRTILDVGCGGGLFTLRLAKRYPDARVVGIDLSEEAIAFANKQSQEHPEIKNIQFQVSTSPHLDYPPGSFDVITSTLVCHHLNDEEIVRFLKDAHSIASQAVILNDLHRHVAARASFALITPLLFANRMIFHDGLISIKRAFKRKDWMDYLEKANLPKKACSISWQWAFRWIVCIQTM